RFPTLEATFAEISPARYPLRCSTSFSLLLTRGEKNSLMLSRGEAVKALWAYARDRGLQDPSNKKIILCNREMKDVFRREQLDFHSVAKAVSEHLEAGPSTSRKDSKTASSSMQKSGGSDAPDLRRASDPLKELIMHVSALTAQERGWPVADGGLVFEEGQAMRWLGDYIKALRQALRDCRLSVTAGAPRRQALRDGRRSATAGAPRRQALRDGRRSVTAGASIQASYAESQIRKGAMVWAWQANGLRTSDKMHVQQDKKLWALLRLDSTQDKLHLEQLSRQALQPCSSPS
ncbi:hypothetical protein CYMTET_44882, partial [Cymbomonas tetramitiformis]